MTRPKATIRLIGCPICDSPNRVAYDSEILAGIGNAETTDAILMRVLKIASELDPRFLIDVAQLEHHAQKHAIGGQRADSRGMMVNVVRLPNGQEIVPTDLPNVLSLIIGAGLLNMLAMPETINPTHLLRAIELLKDLKGGGGEMEELMLLLKQKLGSAPPDNIDLKDNPYAAKSPVGNQ